MSIWRPSAWRSARDRVAAAWLPQPCLLCGSRAGRDPVCSACFAALPRLSDAVCAVCAQPLGSGATGASVCGACLTDPPAFDATVAAFRYAFPLDRLIQALKYGHRLSVAPFLGTVLAERSLQAFGKSAPDLVVAVPLAPARIAERGFNQSRELAAPVAAALGRPLHPGLHRIRDTAKQADLPWQHRARNVRDAFVGEATVSLCHVLVIDDVMTTGATLDATAKALKSAGAARVTNLVVARATRDQSSMA